MRRSLRGLSESSFAREILWFIFLGGALYLAITRTPAGETFNRVMQGRRGTLYSTLLSAEGALLGFVVAVLAIVLGYAQAPRLEIIRRSRHWAPLFGAYTRSMRWAACATLTSLIGLVLDTEASPSLLLAVGWTTTVLMSVLFTARMLWVTQRVVDVAIQAHPRPPGG